MSQELGFLDSLTISERYMAMGYTGPPQGKNIIGQHDFLEGRARPYSSLYPPYHLE